MTERENLIDAEYIEHEITIESVRNQDTQESQRLIERSQLGSGNVVYLCFLLLGLGTLLPWNFFITADSYWQYKFRNSSETEYDFKPRETELQRLYDPMQVCLSQAVNFTFLFINTLFSHMFPQKIRLISSLVIMIILFSLTTAFAKIDTDHWQLGFFIVTMLSIVLLSASGATFQGGLFGVASLFPQRYINAVGVGQALGGVFASVARILSVYLGTDQVTSAFLYFLTAVMVMVLTLLEYLYVSRTAYFKSYSSGSVTRNREEDVRKPEEGNVTKLLKEQYKVFKLIWPYGLSVCLVFLITLSVFPVICVKVVSTSHDVVWATKYFQPVSTFLLFNAFDYLGRMIAEFILWPRRGSRLLFAFAIARVVFIPLFLLCSHDPKSNIPSVFLSDIWYIVFMSCFGFSNGYTFALLMMYAPRIVPESESEKVGLMMATMIGLGLLVGSGSSFAFALIS